MKVYTSKSKLNSNGNGRKNCLLIHKNKCNNRRRKRMSKWSDNSIEKIDSRKIIIFKHAMGKKKHIQWINEKKELNEKICVLLIPFLIDLAVLIGMSNS